MNFNNNKLKIIAGTVVLLHGTFYFTKDYFLATEKKSLATSVTHTNTLKEIIIGQDSVINTNNKQDINSRK